MLPSPMPMHIPDGFLSTLVALVLWACSALVIGYALKRVGEDLGEKQVPTMGVLAACIFAGQMLNFPVTGGTSGHLLGAALVTIVLGPWAAILVMTCVVGIQALVFQDGGLLVLGANLFNMAIVGSAVSYFVYQTIQKLVKARPLGLFLGGFSAGWVSIVVAALACGLQLALSGRSPANLAIPAMAGIHALIGIGEGLITAAALAFIYASRRELLDAQAAPSGRASKVVWLSGLAIAVLLAIASPLASAHPDGLEWVAEQKGFLDTAREPLYRLIPDYLVPGIANESLATIVAGIVGLLAVGGTAYAVAAVRRRRQDTTA